MFLFIGAASILEIVVKLVVEVGNSVVAVGAVILWFCVVRIVLVFIIVLMGIDGVVSGFVVLLDPDGVVTGKI